MTLILSWWLSLFIAGCQSDTTSKQTDPFQELTTFFESGYQNLAIPSLTLSYEQNLRNYSNQLANDKQLSFYQSCKSMLEGIDRNSLSSEEDFEYEIIAYEVDLGLERLELSSSISKDQLNDQGLFHQARGKEWYEHFVKSWSSSDMTPDEVAAFGLSEVTRIKEEMNKLEPGLEPESDAFFTDDKALVERTFQQAKEVVDGKLSEFFPDFPRLPEVGIAQGTNRQLAQTPGYYNSNTFFYNLFDEPFDLRQADWLFIHEANPGHHFQINYEYQVEVPSYRSTLSYSGFREGWAAYIENLGQEVGLYQTPDHYYSKWEWDIVRSIRLVLDVGINHKGWTNEEALEVWKQHVKGQDDIAMREINRMRRWPAQVLTYKIGTKVIFEAQQKVRKEKADQFSLKEFHTTLLSQRSIPVKLIPKLFEI